MSEQLRNLCKQLRLAHVADTFEEVEFSTPHDFLKNVLMKEVEMRDYAKIDRNVKKARFIENKSLESYNWSSAIRLPQTVNKDQLVNLEFIKEHQNLVLVGAPGTGKTHLAAALGRRACEMGYEVRFYRVAQLVEELEAAHRNGKLGALDRLHLVGQFN